MVHNCLCQARDLRYNEVLPGRLLQVRIPGSDTSIDAISFYQFVWRSKQTVSQNKEQRHAALQKLHQTISPLPQRKQFHCSRGFQTCLSEQIASMLAPAQPRLVGWGTAGLRTFNE